MNKDLVVLIVIITAILAFILGYSLSPTQVAMQEKSGPASGAPGYGGEKAPHETAAPGYGSESPSRPSAPGYDEGAGAKAGKEGKKASAPGYDDE